jgi:ATP-binding cassette, subfamily G (WHITE), member 2, SNQ2
VLPVVECHLLHIADILILAGENSTKVLDYFARHGARCPEDTNPADHIVEVIQGDGEAKIDWVDVWNQSPERQQELDTLMSLTKRSQRATSDDEKEDAAEFASPKWFQFKMVVHRLTIQLWRSPVSF